MVVFALLEFLIQSLFEGAIFLFAHIPPKAFNLDGLIRMLLPVDLVLRGPRLILLWLWPGEHTPWLFTWPMALVNSLVWGAVLALLKHVFRR